MTWYAEVSEKIGRLNRASGTELSTLCRQLKIPSEGENTPLTVVIECAESGPPKGGDKLSPPFGMVTKDRYKRKAGSLINRGLTPEQKKLKVKIYYNK